MFPASVIRSVTVTSSITVTSVTSAVSNDFTVEGFKIFPFTVVSAIVDVDIATVGVELLVMMVEP